MEIILVLGILSVILWMLNYTTEHMTNKDLIATLNKRHANVSATAAGLPLMGPQTEKGADYPDVFGPANANASGAAHASAVAAYPSNKEEDSDVYTFNPNLQAAFKTEVGDPKPFLTDISKIQH